MLSRKLDNFIERHYSNNKSAVKGKIDFPQIGFEKGTTERGFQR